MDDYGRATFGRVRKISGQREGVSRITRENLHDYFCDDLHERVQWYNFGNPDDPWMKSRDAEQTLIAYMEDVSNNRMSIGWNPFHAANVNDDFVYTVTDVKADANH